MLKGLVKQMKLYCLVSGGKVKIQINLQLTDYLQQKLEGFGKSDFLRDYLGH